MINTKKFFRALFDSEWPSIPYTKSESCTIYGFFEKNTNVYNNKHFYLINYYNEYYFAEKQKSIYEAFNLKNNSRYDKISKSILLVTTDIENNSHKICILDRANFDTLLFLENNFKSIAYSEKDDDMFLINDKNEWFHILYDLRSLYKHKTPVFKKSFKYLKTSDL